MDVTIHKELLSIMMLYSLPSSFENFRIAIESRDALPSPEDLKIKIIEESEARKQSHSNEYKGGQEGAFYTKKGKYCKFCKKKGHDIQSCWHKKKNKHTGEKTFNMCMSLPDIRHEYKWCLDSGCTSHMCGNKNLFEKIYNEEGQLKLASNYKTAQIQGRGIVKLKKDNIIYNLNDVLFVPDISTNLISIGKLTEKGFTVKFKGGKAHIIEKNGKIFLSAKRENGLYYIDFDKRNFEKKQKANFTSNINNNIMEWHRKLGHLNENDLKLISNKVMIKGIKFNNEKLEKCETCLKGKMSSLPFTPISKVISKEPLQIIHTDVCGPFNKESLGGSKYYVTFTDDFTRYTCIYFIKNKTEVLDKFKQYKNNVEKCLKTQIQSLQSDNGTEYINRAFNEYLNENGISRRLSAPYTPQQNGISERKNRTLMNKARCLMLESKLPDNLWAEAVNTANYLVNRSPTKVLKGYTPYQKWVGKIPSGGHLHVFGCKAFVLNKKRRGKFSPKATEGVFVGYAKNAKGFRIYLPKENTVIISRDVKFIDEKMYYNDNRSHDDFAQQPNEDEESQSETEKQLLASKDKRKYYYNKPVEITLGNLNNNDLPLQEESPRTDVEEESPRTDIEVSIQSEDEWIEAEENENLSSPRSKRERRPPCWTKDYILSSEMGEIEFEPETSYLSNENDNWNDAIKAEIKAHIKNETWVIVKKDKNMKPVSNKMILKKKLCANNEEIMKARLVARGFTQRPGLDYNETFAPVAKLSSIRSVVAMSAQKDFELCQMDVTTAYLNGDIEEEITMQIPENLEKYVAEIMMDESDKEDLATFNKARKMLKDLRYIKGDKICKLQRSLYGLKQSGRQWFKKLDMELKNIGFMPTSADPCVYILEKGGEKLIITIYVDDFLISYSCPILCEEVKSKLMKVFEMKDMGKPKRIIGMDFSYDDDGIKLNQRQYIEKLLQDYNMSECKPVKTPIEPRLHLKKHDKIDEKLPFKNLMGALMFLAVATRPDIMYACSYLSQFNDSYGADHFKCAKRILRYLKGTKSEGLKYKKTNTDMYGMADADWGSDKEDRKSFSGYCYKYANACISWTTKKQKCVALSTAEAEYIALTEAAKEALHLHSLFRSLGLRKEEKVIILSDNQAAIKLGTNPIISNKSKHIDLKLHFIRDCIKNRQIVLQYKSTDEMEADLLTKGLPGPRLEYLRRRIGVSP